MAYIPAGGVVKLTQTARLIYGEVSRQAEVKETKNGGTLVKFGVCVGADDKGDKKYIDCVVFQRGLSAYCADLDRGDPICAIGDVESREYNGKTYYSLKLAWVNSPAVSADAEAPPFAGQGGGTNEASSASGEAQKWQEQDADEEDLPF